MIALVPAPADDTALADPGETAMLVITASMDRDGRIMPAALRGAIAQAISAERSYWRQRLAAEEAKTAGWWE